MDQPDMQELLEKVRAGRLSVPRALERLRHLPFEDLGFAKIDHHRGVRQGLRKWSTRAGKRRAR